MTLNPSPASSPARRPQTGSFPITVKATDANGCTGTGATYTLVIACQTITVTTRPTTTGTVDAPFSQTFTQSGAARQPATFSLNSGTLADRPHALVAGVLSGTPTQTGSFPITVTVTDGNGCTGTGATYTLVIACQTITVTNPATTTGTVDRRSARPSPRPASARTADGLHDRHRHAADRPDALGAGVLSGTPSQPGTFPITVKVTDANGCTGIERDLHAGHRLPDHHRHQPSHEHGAPARRSAQTFTQTGVGTHTPAVFTTAAARCRPDSRSRRPASSPARRRRPAPSRSPSR